VLRAKFGITLEEYNRKAANQNHLCAICGKPEPSKKTLSVDHNHKTNQVRDLLCSRCNPSLGGFMDSPEFLLKAYEYLVRWTQLKDNFYGNDG
jgi:ribosomal protein L34E